jgi:hypothetical protein
LELRVGGMKELRNAEVVRTTGRSTLTIRIDGRPHEILLLKIEQKLSDQRPMKLGS